MFGNTMGTRSVPHSPPIGNTFRRTLLRFFTRRPLVATVRPRYCYWAVEDSELVTREELMDWFAGEPTLEDTLSDPIVRAIMKCDDIELVDFRRFLEDVGSRMNFDGDRGDWPGGGPRQTA